MTSITYATGASASTCRLFFSRSFGASSTKTLTERSHSFNWPRYFPPAAARPWLRLSRPALDSYAEIMRNVSILLVLCAAFLLLSLDLHSQAQGPPQPSPEQRAAVDRGRKQFQQACGFCHGRDATGARGPDLVRSALVAHDVNGDLIGEVIRNGRPDKGMPALPLTAAPISDISAFLHARSKEAVESSGVPSDYPFEKLLTGHADKGKAYFE